jgi:hypothetical protein
MSTEEGSDDGYEDLIKDNENKFAMKVNSLKVLVVLWRLMVAGYFFGTAVIVSFRFEATGETIDDDSAVSVSRSGGVIAVFASAEE